jgi:hypothetical protein
MPNSSAKKRRRKRVIYIPKPINSALAWDKLMKQMDKMNLSQTETLPSIVRPNGLTDSIGELKYRPETSNHSKSSGGGLSEKSGSAKIRKQERSSPLRR